MWTISPDLRGSQHSVTMQLSLRLMSLTTLWCDLHPVDSTERLHLAPVAVDELEPLEGCIMLTRGSNWWRCRFERCNDKMLFDIDISLHPLLIFACPVSMLTWGPAKHVCFQEPFFQSGQWKQMPLSQGSALFFPREHCNHTLPRDCLTKPKQVSARSSVAC